MASLNTIFLQNSDWNRLKQLKAYDLEFKTIKLIRHGTLIFERLMSFHKLPAETMSVDIMYNRKKQRATCPVQNPITSSIIEPNHAE